MVISRPWNYVRETVFVSRKTGTGSINQSIVKGWSVFRGGKNYHWEPRAMVKKSQWKKECKQECHYNEFAWVFPWTFEREHSAKHFLAIFASHREDDACDIDKLLVMCSA
jgi:hypothetical protein